LQLVGIQLMGVDVPFKFCGSVLQGAKQFLYASAIIGALGPFKVAATATEVFAAMTLVFLGKHLLTVTKNEILQPVFQIKADETPRDCLLTVIGDVAHNDWIFVGNLPKRDRVVPIERQQYAFNSMGCRTVLRCK
jgi:hypothetical protein